MDRSLRRPPARSASGPVRRVTAAGTYRVEARATGQTIEVYVDGVRALKTRASRTKGAAFGTAAAHGTSYFQNVEVRSTADYFTEPYRPTYHYSQLTGSTSDPCGLLHHDGEYHLFHQDEGRWAHAVSTDLVHWQPLPIALPWTPTATAGPAARSWTPTTPPVSSTAARA
ncbi:hypothetical protein SALBM311S_07087 [Streptomyces alboniger]